MRAERIRLVRRDEMDACPVTVLVQKSRFRLGGFYRSRFPLTPILVLEEYRLDRGVVNHVLTTIQHSIYQCPQDL